MEKKIKIDRYFIDYLKRYNVELKEYHVPFENGFVDHENYKLCELNGHPDITNYEYIEPRLYEPDYDLEKLEDVFQGAVLMEQVIQEQGHIALVTDYDTDGITSAVVLTRYFRDILKYPKDKYTTIVNRRNDGNGFNPTLCKRVLDVHNEKSINLIITADHGITNNKEIGIFKNHGIKFLLTDHHELQEDNYPSNADVVIDVMRKDSTYFKGTSGCHVAFLLCLSHYLINNSDLGPMKLLYSYVGISTVVDQMPMWNKHNRNATIAGMNMLNTGLDENFKRFKSYFDSPICFKYKNLGWTIGPYINSGNRCGTEDNVFTSLISRDGEEAKRNLAYAYNANLEKKDASKELTASLIEEVIREYSSKEEDYKFGIVGVINTDFGIAGPLAGRLGQQVNRPTIVFRYNENTDMLLGSGRAILNIDILNVLKDMIANVPEFEYTVRASGHAGACGVSVPKSQLELFKKQFSLYVKKHLNGVIPKDILSITNYHVIQPKDIDLSLALKVESLGPFGRDWSEPIFLSVLKYRSSFKIGTNRLATFYKTDRSTIDGVYYFDRNNGINITNWEGKIIADKYYIVLYTLQLGYFRKKYKLDMTIKDIIPLEEYQGV